MQKKWTKRDCLAGVGVLKLKITKEARRWWSAQCGKMDIEKSAMRKSQHAHPDNLSMFPMNHFPAYGLFLFPRLLTMQWGSSFYLKIAGWLRYFRWLSSEEELWRGFRDELISLRLEKSSERIHFNIWVVSDTRKPGDMCLRLTSDVT